MPRPTRTCWQGLTKRGFKLTPGPDGTGWQIMYQSRGGGYYFDCRLLADDRRWPRRPDPVRRYRALRAEGARLKDGTVRQADLIVLATGYEGRRKRCAPSSAMR